MLGAVAGDVIGAPYARRAFATGDVGFTLYTDISTFTDATVLTVASAEALMTGRGCAETYRTYFRTYPLVGYDADFRTWAAAESAPPNGCRMLVAAMRVSPAGWAFSTLKETLEEAARLASATHYRQEAIQSARAVAGMVFLARTGSSREELRAFGEGCLGLKLEGGRDCLQRAPGVDGDVRDVTDALIAFLESVDYEDAVRRAVVTGPNADARACIAGGIAEAFYPGVPDRIVRETRRRLTDHLRSIIDTFRAAVGLA